MQSNLPDSMKAVSLYSINGGNNSNDNTVALRTAFGDLRDRRRKDNKNASLDNSESLSNEQLKKKDEIAKETLKKLNKTLKKSNKLTIDGQYRDMIIASWKKNLYVEKGNTFKYDNGE
jgi:protein required for attachment to host cells